MEHRIEQPSEEATVPLRLIHIFAWTLLSALFLAIQRWIYLEGESLAPTNYVFATADATECVIYGAAIGGMLLFVVRALWRGKWPLHPGHWLLAAMGVVVIIRNFAWLVTIRFDSQVTEFFYLPDGSPTNFLWSPEFLYSLEGAVGAALFLLIAVGPAKLSSWRVFFALAACIAALRAATNFFPFFGREFLACGGVTAVATIIALLVAIIADGVAGRRRDSFHWIAVACFVVECAVFWGMQIYFYTLEPFEAGY